MELLFLIVIISFGFCLFITRKYFKAKDDLMKKAKYKKYLNISTTINIICILFMIIVEIM